MNIFKSVLCANGVMITFYVFDVLLILSAIGLSIWFYIKYGKPRSQNYKNNQQSQMNNVEKIDDDTYVIDTDNTEATPEFNTEVYEQPEEPETNVIEKFATQITEINEPLTNELKSNTVVMNKLVEEPEPKIVKKDEIENFVMLDGVKKTLTEPEKKKTFNRGANAFQDSTNFLNSIKEEQSMDTKPSKPVAEKTTKVANSTKTTKTTTKKATSTKSKTTKK